MDRSLGKSLKQKPVILVEAVKRSERGDQPLLPVVVLRGSQADVALQLKKQALCPSFSSALHDKNL